jgi:uncharacterized protein (TIGR02452 family)
METFDIKMKNIDCWEDTKQRSTAIPPPPPSIKHEYDPNFQYPRNTTSSNIEVHNMDTLDCAFLYNKPLVLNLADDVIPGGWVNVGSSAQEESLFRRANYHLSLVKPLYPILDTQAIYSPSITVLKGSDLEPIEPFRQFDFIACPGIKYPFLDEDDAFEEEDRTALEIKIELIIQLAITYEHDTIIFGAMGCGAWQNPPKEVAHIFERVLNKYDGCVSNYIFAILDNEMVKDNDMDEDDDECEKESNYEIFKRILYKSATVTPFLIQNTHKVGVNE